MVLAVVGSVCFGISMPVAADVNGVRQDHPRYPGSQFTMQWNVFGACSQPATGALSGVAATP